MRYSSPHRGTETAISPLFNLEKCFQRKETKKFQFPFPFSLEMEAQKTLISFPSIWTNVSKGWNQLSLFCIGRFLDLDFHFRNHLLFFSESFFHRLLLWLCLRLLEPSDVFHIRVVFWQVVIFLERVVIFFQRVVIFFQRVVIFFLVVFFHILERLLY